MIKAFPKIFTLGQDYISDIFKEGVEITEKIDGSQFCFGKINGELFVRSKGAMLYINAPDKMFKLGVDYIVSIQDRIRDNTIYYAEYLSKPKHNVLKYNRVPKNNIILFGVSTVSDKFQYGIKEYADELDIETVPVLYFGTIDNTQQIVDLLETQSILGGTKIEGVVVKNYYRPFLLGGQPIPIMAGKFVSEAFKEVHRAEWKQENTGPGKWEVFANGFKTEARWLKAIQHLRDKGLLENSPRDIGILLKEVREDIVAEEKETILKFLWNEFQGDILRKSTIGLPEWYKTFLLKSLDTEKKDDNITQ